MDVTEYYSKYSLEGSIFLLYPSVCNKPGKYVLLIFSNGPAGCTDLGTRTFLRALGFKKNLLPSIPNTFNVTQATDWNYGYFKLMYKNV